MFGFTLGLKGIAAASVAAFVFGGIAGAKITSNYYKSGIYAAKVKNLEKQIEARDSAAIEDSHKAIEDRKANDELKRINRDLQMRIAAGQCFGADDTARLRDFFAKAGQSPASASRLKGLLRK